VKQIRISKLIKLGNIGPLFYVTNIVGHIPLLFQYATELRLTQLKIRFFSPSLKKCSFDSVMFNSYEKCVVYCTLNFCWWNWRHLPECFLFSDHLPYEDYYYMLYPVTCSTSNSCKGSDLVNGKPHSPAYYSVTKNTGLTSSSSIGITTLVGFGLLNYHWAFSAGRFYRVSPAARQTPNLEENWLNTAYK
jgi:hypothetical protein